MTLALASVAVARLVQTRPRVTVPFLLCRLVQPVGLPSVPLSELVAMNSTRTSPGCTVVGIRTVWLVRLPALLAVATCESVAAVVVADGVTVRVVWAVVVPSLTVRVTVLLPVEV